MLSSAMRKGLCLAVGLPCAAQAHHSIVVHYDPENIRSITGTVESVKWANPHTEWVLSVENDQGEVETWRAEGGALNTLARNGISSELFPVGRRITITGMLSRRGRPEMIAVRAAVAGEEYGLFPALEDELDEELPERERTLTSAAGYVVSYEPAPDLFRVWTPVDFPATGVRPQALPLTDEAGAALEAYDPVAGDLAAQCIPAGMPSMLDQPYPIEFIDERDRIIMRVEEWNGVRTIHMTDDSPGEGVGTIFGHSIGHWDGETLVIETTGIGYAYYNDAGAPMTEEMVVTERYTLSADGRRMDWTATSVDPNVFTAPVSMSGWAVWAPDIGVEEFHCSLD